MTARGSSRFVAAFGVAGTATALSGAGTAVVGVVLNQVPMGPGDGANIGAGVMIALGLLLVFVGLAYGWFTQQRQDVTAAVVPRGRDGDGMRAVRWSRWIGRGVRARLAWIAALWLIAAVAYVVVVLWWRPPIGVAIATQGLVVASAGFLMLGLFPQARRDEAFVPQGSSTPDDAALLVVVRSGDAYGVARSLQVRVDGRPVGAVRAGARCEIRVAPGSYRVSVHMDGASSPALAVDLAARQVVTLGCGPAAGYLTTTLDTFLRPGRLFFLRRVERVSGPRAPRRASGRGLRPGPRRTAPPRAPGG